MPRKKKHAEREEKEPSETKHSKHEKVKLKVKVPKINVWTFTTIVLAIFVALSLTQGWCIACQQPSKDVIGQKAIDYINRNLVREGTSATLVSVEDMGDVYKVTTEYQGQQIPVYVTKDGRFLFLANPLDMGKELPKPKEQTEQNKVSCEDLPKAETPKLQAFVVSYCPFGLQMQRILTRIVEKIPQLKDFIKIRYIGSVQDGKIVSMHGDREAQENLRQICIREEQPEKYWDYIACFIKAGDTENCLNETGVNVTMLNECMEDSNRGLKYAQQDFELEKKFQVMGSPTLVLNNQTVSEFDFGGRTAQAVKTLLCCGFEQQPEFCQQNLTTEQANTGFSQTYSGGSSSSGQC